RYVYYRCRSQAGGRPPCPGVNISVFELESCLSDVLADAANDRPEIPRELRQRWSQFAEFERWSQLPSVVQSVRYHCETGEITLELKDDLTRSSTDLSMQSSEAASQAPCPRTLRQ